MLAAMMNDTGLLQSDTQFSLKACATGVGCTYGRDDIRGACLW